MGCIKQSPIIEHSTAHFGYWACDMMYSPYLRTPIRPTIKRPNAFPLQQVTLLLCSASNQTSNSKKVAFEVELKSESQSPPCQRIRTSKMMIWRVCQQTTSLELLVYSIPRFAFSRSLLLSSLLFNWFSIRFYDFADFCFFFVFEGRVAENES